MGTGEQLFRLGSGEKERGSNFHFQKGWGMEVQIATALPENPGLQSVESHMFILLGMQAYS